MCDIVPINNNGSIQLKFSVDGERYSFNPIRGRKYSNKRHLAIATSIATQIQNDILTGVFEHSLDKYRHQSTARKAPPTRKRGTKQNSPQYLMPIWDTWVETLDLSPATKADHYEMIRRMITKANPKATDIKWLLESTIAPSTFNKRLGYLKSCGKWAVSVGKLTTNPFESVKSRKTTKSKPKPFTLKEIRAIISAFDQRFSHYGAFVRFLFMTGVRTSEAIGLRWKFIDFDRQEIIICESLSKDRTGNGYKRIRKSTKTGNVRHLRLNSELAQLLKGIRPDNFNPDDLVFLSSKGCVIDAGNFREDWKEVLEGLKISYRKPYTTRHTLLSHAIEKGMPITSVAYIAGHSDSRMVMETYGHMINRPDLPDLDL
ncbi:MAG: site-specific integrase [Cyanobacteria bacterium P01_F01_bin.150]